MSNRYATLLFIFLVLLLTARLGAAQANLQPGYIVSLAGDTTRGLVAGQNGQNSALSCRFRATPAAGETVYAPAQLRAYGRNEQQFETYPVPINGSTPTLRFLTVVERGPVSLFLLVDVGSQDRFFITGAPGLVIELRRVVRARPDKGSTFFETDNFYQDELEQAFRRCPAVQRQVRQVRFNLASLQQAVQRYNRCQQPAASVRPMAAQRGIQARISAALHVPAYHTLQLGAGQGRVGTDDKLKGDFYLAGGLLFSTTSTFHNPHFSFVTGVLFEVDRPYRVERAYRNLSYSPYYQKTEVTASLDYFKMPLLARYRWSGSVVRPYVEAGMAVRRLLSLRRNTVTDTYEATFPFPVITYDLFNEHQTFTPAPVVGVGVQFGRPDQR